MTRASESQLVVFFWRKILDILLLVTATLPRGVVWFLVTWWESIQQYLRFLFVEVDSLCSVRSILCGVFTTCLLVWCVQVLGFITNCDITADGFTPFEVGGRFSASCSSPFQSFMLPPSTPHWKPLP